MPFPHVDGEALSGRRVAFPRDFVRPTIAVVLFDQHQRVALESWLPFIMRHVNGGTADAYVFGALAHSMRMMSGMISTLMRAAVPAEARDRTVPLFVDVDTFCAVLEAERAPLGVFVVLPGGDIVARAAGPFTEALGSLLQAHLEVTV